jgi:hypothetical protein
MLSIRNALKSPTLLVDWEAPSDHDQKLTDANPGYKSSLRCAASEKRIPLMVTVKDQDMAWLIESSTSCLPLLNLWVRE